ncbi:hypothetical protein VYU27_000203 [Nannochloropsis oceanica]
MTASSFSSFKAHSHYHSLSSKQFTTTNRKLSKLRFYLGVAFLTQCRAHGLSLDHLPPEGRVQRGVAHLVTMIAAVHHRSELLGGGHVLDLGLVTRALQDATGAAVGTVTIVPTTTAARPLHPIAGAIIPVPALLLAIAMINDLEQ